MNDKDDAAKSILEQIVDDMLLNLKTKEEFNDSIVDRLNEIASSGSLTSTKKVIDVIKTFE